MIYQADYSKYFISISKSLILSIFRHVIYRLADVLLRRATIKQHDLHVRLILLMEPVDGKNTYIPMPGYVRKKSVRASIFCKHFANFTPEYGFFCFSYLGFMLWASLPFHRALIHASTTIQEPLVVLSPRHLLSCIGCRHIARIVTHRFVTHHAAHLIL